MQCLCCIELPPPPPPPPPPPLSSTIADGHYTILVSLTQSLLHYTAVSAKMGLNIHKKREEGSFRFVDGLSSLLAQVFTKTGAPSVAQQQGSSSGQRVFLTLGR